MEKELTALKIDRSVTKVCVAVLLFAVLLRLFIGLLVPSASAFRRPQADDMLLFGAQTNFIKVPMGNGMQPKPTSPSIPGSTGSTLPPASSGSPETSIPGTSAPDTVPSTAPTTTPTTQPTTPPTEPPELPYDPRPGLPVFTRADKGYIDMQYASNCSQRPDIGQLLERRLELDLDNGQPAVLIVHSHATECFTKGEGEVFDCHAQFRSKDTNYNMVSIGDALAAQLEAAGIQVIHDRTLHDYMNYDGAYDSSRRSVQEYLELYPSIQVVLDLHRDALQNPDGSYAAPVVTIDGQEAAKFSIVMGSTGTYYLPNWKTNLSFALKLNVLMEQEAPGIVRQVTLRNSRYNQDLSPNYVLIECGSAGNTHAQVLRSVPVMAQAIIALIDGAN